MDRHTAGSSAKVISGINTCTVRECGKVLVRWRLFTIHILLTATPPGDVLVGYPSTIFKPSFYYSSFFYDQISLIAIMPTNSTGFEADSNMSGIPESRALPNKPATSLPIHTTTTQRFNLLPPLRCITGSDIPV